MNKLHTEQLSDNIYISTNFKNIQRGVFHGSIRTSGSYSCRNHRYFSRNSVFVTSSDIVRTTRGGDGSQHPEGDLTSSSRRGENRESNQEISSQKNT